MGDDRPVRYIEDGKTYYRASGLMFCDKVFVALVNNYSPMSHPAWFQEVLDEGSRMESEIIDMYITQNDVPIEDSQLVVELEVLDDVFIRGSIDGRLPGGLIIQGNDLVGTAGALFEAKKFRESTWNKFLRQGVECMPWYPWQVSAYMHGLGVDECEFTGGLYDKDNDKILEIYTHHLAMPPIPLLALQKRVAKLEALINSEPDIDDVKCTVRMFPCPFHYLHPADDPEQLPEKPADEIIEAALTELDEITAEQTPLNKRQKELEERKKLVKSGIHAWMQLAGVDDDEAVVVAGHEIKFHTSFVRGYEVQPNERLNVTAKPVKVGKRKTK